MITIGLVVLHVIASALLILFILLHSGRGSGLSDVFGGGSGALGGAGAVERNLDRITIAAAVVFGVTTVLLGLRLAS
jgi:preprotein translocase subunit SecG